MARRLPSAQETVQILAAKRTRRAPGPPPQAGRAVAKILKPLDARYGQGADGLMSRWREIVGDELALRTEPSRLVRSRLGGAALELRVAGAMATIIQHRTQDILDRVNLFLGAGAVDRIRIVQGPLRGAAKRAPKARPGPARRLGAPLDSSAEAALAETLSTVADERLRGALLRLGREVLRARPVIRSLAPAPENEPKASR